MERRLLKLPQPDFLSADSAGPQERTLPPDLSRAIESMAAPFKSKHVGSTAVRIEWMELSEGFEPPRVSLEAMINAYESQFKFAKLQAELNLLHWYDPRNAYG